MRFTQSLKKNYQFRTVYNKGKSVANHYLVVYALRNGENINRLGVSVSKKVGKSVVRSHKTRLVKESYRLMEGSVKAGYDLIFIVRVNAKDTGYHQINQAMRNLLVRLKLLENEKQTGNRSEAL